MLPPFIIDQIREREERERDESAREQPRLELPFPSRHSSPPGKKSEPVDAPKRGVTEIQVW